MARRRKRKNNKFNQLVAYSLAFLFVILLVFVFLNLKSKIRVSIPTQIASGTNFTGQKVHKKESKIYANMTIHGTGEIKQIPYNLQVSTSYELIFSGKKFFAKSDKYLLGNYLNQKIQFTGEVIGFSPDNIPVLNIDSIYDQENTEKEESQKLSEQLHKYLTASGLIINLENYPGNFEVALSGKNIEIYKVINSFSGENLTGEQFSGTSLSGSVKKEVYLKISPFKCIPGNSVYDCEKLEKQFKMYKFSTITNDYGVTFYKLPETNQYEFFGAEYGYFVYPITGDVYNLLNTISVVNTKEQKLSAIKQACQNDNIQMQSILDISYTGDNYQVIGVDQNANKIICKLTLALKGNTYVAKLKKLDYLRETTKNSKQQISTGLNDNDYLIYSSRAFLYKLYMPKWIKYEADLVNEDFGVAGLKCLQEVKIAYRKTGNLSDPAVKVYYCKTNLDSDTLSSFLSNQFQNFKILKVANKTFIIIYKDNEIANKILNYLKIF